MMHPTHNTMDLAIRTSMVNLLQVTLAELTAAQLAAKQAHWTVRGPGFIALHELFDQVVARISESADLVAERIAQLGGHAEGTLQSAASRTTVEAYPVCAATVDEHVSALSSLLAAVSAHCREGIDQAAEAGDLGTSDLYTEVARTLDKDVWFIESQSTAMA